MHPLSVLNIIIGFFAFLLNSSLLLLLVCHRMKFSLQPSMDFLKNMLFCHILSSTYSIYFELDERFHVKNSISVYIYVLFVTLSISAICAINIDRFIYIRFPLKYNSIISKKRAKILIAINYTLPGTCFVTALLLYFTEKKLFLFVFVAFIILAVTGIMIVVTVTIYVFLTVKKHRTFYGSSMLKGTTSISRSSSRSKKQEEKKQPALTGAFSHMARDYFGFDSVPVVTFNKQESKIYFARFLEVRKSFNKKDSLIEKEKEKTTNGERNFSAVGLLSKDLLGWEQSENFNTLQHPNIRGNRPITYIALVLSSAFIICGIPNVVRAAFTTLDQHPSIYLPLVGNLFMNINILLDPIVILMKNLKIRRELKKFMWKK